MTNNSIYNISLQSIDDKVINLTDYKGRYMLFVNVASYCGYTHQYKELQILHDKFKNLIIIGLPCNQFLFQEPFSEKSIKKFCQTKYNISFLMTKKIYVKGRGQHKIYKWLTNKDLNKKMNSTVKWNFQKYLIGKEGELINFFPSKTSPLSKDITQHITSPLLTN